MSTGVEVINQRVKEEMRFVDDVRTQMSRVIVGQQYLVDRLIIGLLTNGHLLRLERAEVRGGVLAIDLGDTTYADFLATNCNPGRRGTLAPRELANPLGTSALVVSGDGHCILGLRGGAVLLHQGHVHTIGGMFEAADLVDGQVDPAGSILREIEEELGLADADLDDLVCRGVMRDLDNLQPELMFEARAVLTAAEIEARWQGAPSRDEHRELVRVPDDRDAIEAFLGAGKPMAPQAWAALELRARP